MQRRLALSLIACAALAGPARAQTPLPVLDRDGPVAFLGLVFLDLSTEGAYFGKRADEEARLHMLGDEVRTRFRAEGLTLMDLAPIAEELDRTVNPADCYGCDVRMGKKLGAAYVLVGEVQKVSNLILSMNLVMRETETGRMVRGLAVDIWSNTDQSWRHGMRYILNNHFFSD